MKLHYSAASPFARKVRAAAIECGLDGEIALLATNAHESEASLVAANPLSKVPALERDVGEPLFESLLICEYLDHRAGGGILFPRDGVERVEMLRRHALANGLTDALVLRRVETTRAKDGDRDLNIARQAAIATRVLDSFERDAGRLGQALDLAQLTLAVALDYSDFRFPGDRWREGRPALAAWHADDSRRRSLEETRPK